MSELVTVDNGEKLMQHLTVTPRLPDVLFLDLNIPRKNGSDCLNEIKQHAMLAHVPVVIYSTSLHEHVADLLYHSGAHHYVRKAGLAELEQTLHKIVLLIQAGKFVRPARDKFILSIITL